MNKRGKKLSAFSAGALALSLALFGGVSAAYATEDTETPIVEEILVEELTNETPPDETVDNTVSGPPVDTSNEQENPPASDESQVQSKPQDDEPKDNGPPHDRELICPDITDSTYEDKVDVDGDPATVPVDAPDGYLIAGYCVKAGTEPVIVMLDEPVASVDVDHPTKDSVSHYQLLLVKKMEEPKSVKMNLTFIQQKLCEGVDPLYNIYRVTNESVYSVPFKLEIVGQGVVHEGVAEPGFTFVNLPVEHPQTVKLTGGGGDTGFVAFSVTKAGGQNIVLDADDPLCAEEPEEVVAYIDVLVEKGCGFIEYTFVNETDEPLSENQFARTITWTYTNSDGEFVEFDQVANAERVVVTVLFDEDQNGGTVSSFAGEAGQQLREDEVDTDCEDPVLPPSPFVNIEQGCGYADVLIDYPAYSDEGGLSAAATAVRTWNVIVDGEIVETVMLSPGESFEERYSFPEDFNGGSVELTVGEVDAPVAPLSVTIDTDCKAPPVEDPELAYTGGNQGVVNGGLVSAGILLVLGGLFMAFRRRLGWV